MGEVIFGMAGAPAACQYNEFALKFSQVNIASTGLVVGFYALAHRYTTPLILKITMVRGCLLVIPCEPAC